MMNVELKKHRRTREPEKSVPDAVPALLKTIRIIEYLEEKEDGASFAEISGALHIPGSTTFRILKTLQQHRFLVKNANDHFLLGTRFLSLAHNVYSKLNLVKVALPFLENFREKTNETCKLMKKEGIEAICLLRVESTKEMRVTLSTGTRSPIHAGAAGKLLLAHSSEEEIAEVVASGLKRYTPNTITDPEELRAELSAIRLKGFGEDNEEYRLGVKGLAYLVLDYANEPVAAVGCPYLASEVDDVRRKGLMLHLYSCAREISEALGSV